jgi:hypothetical protein
MHHRKVLLQQCDRDLVHIRGYIIVVMDLQYLAFSLLRRQLRRSNRCWLRQKILLRAAIETPFLSYLRRVLTAHRQ